MLAASIHDDIRGLVPYLSPSQCVGIAASWMRQDITKNEAIKRLEVLSYLRAGFGLLTSSYHKPGQAMAIKMVEEGLSVQESKDFVVAMRKMLPPEKAFVETMLSGNFHPNQISAFIKTKDRDFLVRQWIKEPGTSDKIKDILSKANTISSLTFVVGISVVSAIGAVGMGIGSQDLVDAATQTSTLWPQLGRAYDKLTNNTAGFWSIMAWSAFFSGKAIGNIMAGASKKPETDLVRKNLEDKIFGAYNRETAAFDGQTLHRTLNNVRSLPESSTHLVSHLDGVSLMLYVNGNEEVRATILGRQRPSVSQRMDAASLNQDNTIRRFRTRVNESLFLFGSSPSNPHKLPHSPTNKPA